ncbi:PrsW family intramembrane metalloprotease [Streptomyces sp. DSM 44917]|uniref:PrsW family intramembrane metalloprotease n=1 Tax=Streptomyces boetiae TaxID=3075541 RepID=A0ABU2L9W6_9ACTN|nr:PrsW family intramembrane metalloprotease [Streptomyces sp. DSM 44917]MDT0308358.1 PrsW family intramembrane metalloprotease [Streptomyces sp. DSM 44917]
MRTASPLRIGVPLLLCGLLVTVLMWRELGGEGVAAGLLLALVPVPFLLGAFRWLDSVAPAPWRPLAFAFGWGACAATLFALVVGGALIGLVSGDFGGDATSLRPAHADALELTVIAPVVEESAKAAAVLLLFVHRPRAFNGLLAGLVAAGVTATGFAFTENVLYLGSAFTQDHAAAPSVLLGAGTLVTFVVRVLIAPFAHPVFTALTGIGFGLAATLPPERGRALRVGLPLAGLAAAMGLHSAWNASASMTVTGFVLVYLLLMFPVFCGLCWLAARARRVQLRVVREVLPLYAAAGWLTPDEPEALASPEHRSRARELARRMHGQAGRRAVADYQRAATSLALLRERAERGVEGPEFRAEERELLARIERHRSVAVPVTLSSG